MIKFSTPVPIYDWAILTVRIVDAIIGPEGNFERASYERIEDHCIIELEEHRLTHGAISHEAGHCAWDVLTASGVKVTSANDEAKVYLQDWIVRWITYRLYLAGIKTNVVKTFNGHGKMERTKIRPRFV